MALNLRKNKGSELSSATNFASHVTMDTRRSRYEEDIDIEAEKFIEEKLKNIGLTDSTGTKDTDARARRLVEQKHNASKKEEDVYIDVKAEEFINQKKAELSKWMS